MAESLPPNLATAADVLSERPLTPDELAAALRVRDIVIPAPRLGRLPERFPLTFGRDGQGRLCMAVAEVARPGEYAQEEPARDDRPAWWRIPAAEPIDPSDADVSFGDGGPFDLRILALLHNPTGPVERLGDLTESLGVTSLDECLRVLLDKIDGSEPSWQLAAACLTAAGNGWARVLAFTLPRTAADGLTCAPDPLLTQSGDSAHRNATGAVQQALARLGELGYAHRPTQDEMARTVAAVLDAGGLLAVEAPTGTGKSLAYLAAAAGKAAAGRKPVIVATATKVLQQQLRRDAARMQQQGLFPVPFRQIFGVSNYICARELATALDDSDADAGPEHWLALAVAVRALATATTGTWDEVTDADLARTQPDYRTTRDTLRTDASSCERHACPHVARCPLFQRLSGMPEQPGVVAVNHALIATWAKLAEQGLRGPGDVLKDGDLVLDEAHELEDSLTGAWTDQLTRHGLLALAARIDGRFGLVRHLRRLARRGRDPRGGTTLPAQARQLRKDIDTLTEAVGRYVHEYGGANRTAVLRPGVVGLRTEYRELVEVTRTTDLTLRRLAADLEQIGVADARLTGLIRAVGETRELLGRLRDLPDEHLRVYQVRAATDDPGWTFESIPIDVGSAFAAGVVRPARSVTLTSATLTVGGSFTFLADRLGVRMEPGSTEPGVFDGRRLRSPFNHAEQSAVVLTNHLPVPVPGQEREFVEELARDQVGLLSLTGGRAMTLFASRQRMTEVAALVRKHGGTLAEQGVHLLVQGEHGAAEIGRRFRAEPSSVVYGLRSYWQGFDAPGETLSYLVIEKPPYPHPDDAVVSARVRAVADRGGDPFLEYLVPKTATLLAQGFGRLIRTETDRGVALICDRRLQSPSTANRMLLSALPGPAVHHADDRDDAWRYALRFVTGEEPDLTAALQLAGSDVDAALQRLRLAPGEDPEAKLREGARVLFGIDELREPQLRLMLAHLAGHDTVGILPTGMGKSLCFQLPALLRPENRATVVVSPLVALIKDQLDGLRGRLGLRGVQGITGNTSATIRNEIVRDLAAGKVRLLYVSPERLVRDPVLRVALEKQDLGGLVVDEAHCVSDWGHDFRPEFRRVSQAVAHLDRAPRMALTATATGPVAVDIAATLDMPEPVTVRLPSDRPNLGFRVVKVTAERERARELLRIATSMGDAPGIVYASRRATTEEIAALLRRAGIPARHYHAGMVPEQREAVQDDFLAGTTQVIVATKAFGMGVNKPDIAWVVHFDLPDSLDAYVQEAGRAARTADLNGECVLLYTGGDIARRRSHLADAGDLTRLSRTRDLLTLLATQSRRNGDVVFDSETVAEAAGIESDELNVLLAWLERAGALEQLPDCSARGTVHAGVREPADLAERRRFRERSVLLNLRPEVASRIDFDRLAAEKGVDPDELEQDLVAWSLDRLITFSSSQRYRRVRLLSDRVDEVALSRQVRQWNHWQRQQLDAIIAYVNAPGCRRAAVVRYFGFPGHDCGDTHQACDNCGGRPAWQDVDPSAVPDPDQLVNVDVVVLQATAWASTLRTGRYGAGGLKQAVLGSEMVTGGLRRCPQFGALRHVRAAERRFDDAVAALAAAGYLERAAATRDGRTYESLVITVAGQERLGVRVG